MWLLATAAFAQAPPPLPPDARFALALYCSPSCGDEVLDALDAGLADIPNRGGFPDRAGKPLRIMGMAGPEFGIPDADFVALYGVDVDRPEDLAKSQEVLLAWFASPREDAVATLAKAHAAFAKAAELSHGWVEDLDTQKLYGAAAWSKLDPRGPVTDWFVVDADAQDPDAEASNARLVTRGLRRYGDFELVVEDVDPDDAGDVSFIVDAIAREIHGKAEVPATLAMKTDEVRGTATFRPATRRDDDPEEPLLRVSFEGEITVKAAPEPAEPPASPLPVASNGDDTATTPLAIPATPTPPIVAPTVPTPPAPAPAPAPVAAPAPAAPQSLDEAKAQAKQRLETTVREAWTRGLPAGAAVAVKAPFHTSAGGTEYMWVELRKWEGDVIVGELKNEPFDVPGLHKGATVTVREGEVYDYVWVKGDGTKEGNTTAKFLK